MRPGPGRFRTDDALDPSLRALRRRRCGGTLVIQADDKITAGDAELQFQLGNLLTDETRFREALDAYDRALQTDDHDLQVRARAGKVKTALRIAEFDLAQKEGELLRASRALGPGGAVALRRLALVRRAVRRGRRRVSAGAVDQQGIVARTLRRRRARSPRAASSRKR